MAFSIIFQIASVSINQWKIEPSTICRLSIEIKLCFNATVKLWHSKNGILQCVLEH